MEATPELEAFLAEPAARPGRQGERARRGDDRRADPTVRNFVRVVASKGRRGQLPQIVEEFEAIVDREQGRLSVELTTAHELDDAETAAIVRQIEQASGRTVEATRLGRPRPDRRPHPPGRLAARRRERARPPEPAPPRSSSPRT